MKGRERKAKFYFRNEEEVLKELGLKPAAGSGNGWIDKEDGENDYVICQLKSTDKQSYKLNKLDLEKLEYHSNVSNKIPLFVIQFLKDNSRYALMNIEDIPKIAEYIETGETHIENINLDIVETKPKQNKNKIKSSKSDREKFFEERSKEWEEKKRRK